MYETSTSGVPVIGGAFLTREEAARFVKAQIAWDKEEIGEAAEYKIVAVPLNTSLFSENQGPIMLN